VTGRNGYDVHFQTVEGNIKEVVSMVDRCMAKRKRMIPWS